jgi:hypothetical protein
VYPFVAVDTVTACEGVEVYLLLFVTSYVKHTSFSSLKHEDGGSIFILNKKHIPQLYNVKT